MIIVSGIQPSGQLHLGNYFGAIAQILELQESLTDEDEAYFFIADYHAMTSLHADKLLRRYVAECAATYLALGLNPNRITFFRQSDVPQVQELAWILQTITSTGLLNRAVSFKEKVAKGVTPNAGLYTYPVLMAADILIYGGDTVPVGKDQMQNLEICNDIVKTFNDVYGSGDSSFKLVKPLFPKSELECKVPGTDGQKMSKSYKNTISIFGKKKELKAQVNSIVTDSKQPGKEPLDPDTCNAFKLYSLFASEEDKSTLAYRYRNDKNFPGYGTTKQLLLQEMQKRFAAAQERFDSFMSNPSLLAATLAQGAEKARSRACITLAQSRKAVGLGD